MFNIFASNGINNRKDHQIDNKQYLHMMSEEGLMILHDLPGKDEAQILERRGAELDRYGLLERLNVRIVVNFNGLLLLRSFHLTQMMIN